MERVVQQGERCSLENLGFGFLDKNLAQVEGDEAAGERVMPLQELLYDDEVEEDEATEERIIPLEELLLDDDERAEYIELRRLRAGRKLEVSDNSEDDISQMGEELWEGIRQMGGEYKRVFEEASTRQCLSQSFIARNALRLLGPAAAAGIYEDGNGKGDEQMQETSHSSRYNKDKYFWDDLKVTPIRNWEDIGRPKPTDDQPSVECDCCWALEAEIRRSGNSFLAHV